MLDQVQWSRKRKISFVIHVLYALITIISGTYCALLLWQQWFDSWWVASLVITTAEFLCILSLILYIAQIEWPLSFLRHALPFLAIVPVGWELHSLLAANASNDPTTVGSIAIILTAWFVYLERRIITSLENLFIDPIMAAREAAREDIGRVASVLARFQETKNAAEKFAREMLPAPPSPPTITDVTVSPRAFNPVPLQLNESATVSLSDKADPRFVPILQLASMKNDRGEWTHSPQSIQNATRADLTLIETVCRIVRSGQVVIT